MFPHAVVCGRKRRTVKILFGYSSNGSLGSGLWLDYVASGAYHILLAVCYFFNVSPKLRQMDIRVYEAALDLGCNPRQAFFKVVLPGTDAGHFFFLPHLPDLFDR